jgi:hypothetical protein
VPLYVGMLNLSAGLKLTSVCACKFGQVQEKIVNVTRIKIMAIPVEPLLRLIVTKPQ